MPMQTACPLASVDRRLADALRLWNGARQSYFDPDLFRTNVQSAIQALRSVTWILQKEKAKLTGFEAWYEPKQIQMRANPVLRWLVDARNRIEKQGDLETKSTVRTTLYAGWLDSRAHDMELPPRLTTAMLAAALASSLGKSNIVDGCVIRIERRWVDSQLADFEILDALSHAYEFLQLLIFEAHGLFSKPLFEVCEFQQTLRTTNFVLPTEMLTPFARHQWVDAKSGKPINIEHQQRTVTRDAAEKQAEEHYGSSFTEPAAPATNFREQCEYFFKRAKIILVKDGHHISTVVVDKGPQTQIVQYSPNTRAEKHAYIRDIADLCKRIGAHSVMLISEAWTASIPIEAAHTYLHAIDAPDRGEALSLMATNKAGESIEISAAFTRIEGKIILGAEERHEDRRSNLMTPFREAFATSGQGKPEPPPPAPGFFQHKPL
jgi:hypothetical protein